MQFNNFTMKYSHSVEVIITSVVEKIGWNVDIVGIAVVYGKSVETRWGVDGILVVLDALMVLGSSLVLGEGVVMIVVNIVPVEGIIVGLPVSMGLPKA